MSLSITHAFVSSKPDGPDPTKVRPSNWNASHVVTGSLGSDQLSGNNTWTGTNAFNGKVSANVTTVSFSATPTFNAGLGNQFKITLTGNVTSSTVTNLSLGQRLTFYITQDNSGGHTFAWPGNMIGANTIDTTANAVTMQEFVSPDGTNLYAVKGTIGPAGANGTNGADGADGQGFTWLGVWSNATAYAPYDVVSYNGSSYVCIGNTTNEAPDVTPGKWDLFAKGESTSIVSIDDTDSPYTATASNGTVLCDQTSGNIVINLPAVASVEGLKLVFKCIGTTNTITLTPDGSETIDGDPDYVLTTQYNSVTIIAGPTEWSII